jgi:cell pole-organizing protein PopZ
VGSVVPKGTVLGHLLVPSGATAGHMRFAIRPAGDANTIDPRPILAGWEQLDAAVHPQGAKSDTSLRGATAAIRRAHSATSALAARASSSSLLAGESLTPAQWDQLIARISGLPAPSVATKPSAAAIPDPQASPASATTAGSGWAGLSSPTSSPPASPAEPTPRISP